MVKIKEYCPSFCVTHKCNLNCIYCYQKHDDKSMSYDVAKSVVNKIIYNAPEEVSSIQIGFIGGEPLLEFELIKNVCEYAWSLKRKKNYIFHATTNGTVLTENMKNWLVKNVHRFKLTLSLDGTRETHNFNRSNSFDKIDLDFFQKYYMDQGVKMTISEYSINDFAENVQYIHSLGFDIHGSNLAEGDFDWGNRKYLTIMATQLKKLVSYYLKNPKVKECQLLDKNIARCEYKNGNGKTCGIGYGANFFDITGNEYPCPYCTPMTFTEKEIEEIGKTDFKNENEFVDIGCQSNCYLYPICSSCAGNNFKQMKCFNKKDKRRCNLVKLTSLFIAELQAQKLIAGYSRIDEKEKYWTIEAIKKIKDLYWEEFKEYLNE